MSIRFTNSALLPEPGAVHLWHDTLACPPFEAWSTPTVVLDPEERRRSAGYRRPVDQFRFAAARQFLRQTLASYLRIAPADVVFRPGPQGKPELGPPHSESGLTFNLSHSETLVVCAVTRTNSIGVDVERVRPIPKLTALTSRFFAPDERSHLDSLPEDDRLTAFFRIWTLKEAYLKALGVGLSQDPSTVTVPLPDPRQGGLSVCRGPWTFRELALPGGFRGAVVVRGPIASLREHSGDF